MKNRANYKDQEVFVGIDVHARKYAVSCVVDGCVVESTTTVGEPSELLNFFNARFGQASSVQSVYEAGFCGFSLHRRLADAGYSNIVINPASLEYAVNDKVKTDRKDAKKLAMHLYQRRLKSVYIPTEREEHSRLAQRTREQLVKHRKSVMNQVRMKLRQFGYLPSNFSAVLTRRHVEALMAAQELSTELETVLQCLLTIWGALDSEIRELERTMRAQSKEDDACDEVYKQLPGIGDISGRILASELGDTSRFRNNREIASYVGLTPSEHSSGEHIRRGRISRQGSCRIRAILTQSAWIAIRYDAALRAKYNALRARAGSKRAIIAIARKLLTTIHAVFRTEDRVYRPTSVVT